MQTMTTVGYGDMAITTLWSRLFCMCLMIAGVLMFTFCSGALASLMQNIDSDNAD